MQASSSSFGVAAVAGGADAKSQQVMFEALAKAAEIVLCNRVLDPRVLSRRPGRTRFNIEVDEVDVLRGMMEYWRRDLHLPLRILFLWRPNSNSAEKTRLIEKWDVHYALSEQPLTGGEDEAMLLAQVRSLWRRVVVLLRTLYSKSLTLPAAQLVRRTELASRRAGQKRHGSIAFAVCTREADSDSWLLLNGHDSAAYQPNPPLAFEKGQSVLTSNFPPARCAFGSYSISVSYLESTEWLDGAAPPLSFNCKEKAGSLATFRAFAANIPAASLTGAHLTTTKEAPIKKSPSGLSILLASSPQPDDDDDNISGRELRRRDTAPTSSRRRQSDLFDKGVLSASSSPDEKKKKVSNKKIGMIEKKSSDRLDALLLASGSPATTTESRDRSNSIASNMAPPPLGGRQISRSAENAAAHLKSHSWQQLTQFVAPFGYVDEQQTPKGTPKMIERRVQPSSQPQRSTKARPPRSPRSFGTPPFASRIHGSTTGGTSPLSTSAPSSSRSTDCSPPFVSAALSQKRRGPERVDEEPLYIDEDDEEAEMALPVASVLDSLLLASTSSPFRKNEEPADDFDEEDDELLIAGKLAETCSSPTHKEEPPPFAFDAPEPSTTADALAEIVHACTLGDQPNSSGDFSASANPPEEDLLTWSALERDLAHSRNFASTLAA